MSLINDALKRAKEAQQQAPPSAARGLEFKPLEPAPQAERHRSLLLPALIAVAVVAVAMAVLWPKNVGQLSAAGPLEPKQTASSPDSVAATPPVLAPVASEPRPAADPQGELPTQPAKQHQTQNALATIPPNAPAAIPQASVASNSPVVGEPAAPKPPPLKLQAILLNPTHPSAMISGKTLFIGDKIGELRLVAIKQESATLVGAGLTNILTLPQ